MKGLKKSSKIPGNTLSHALLKSPYQIFAADTAKKKPQRFCLAGVMKTNDAHFQLFFCQERRAATFSAGTSSIEDIAAP